MLQTSSELRAAGFTAVAWQPHVHTALHGVLTGKCQSGREGRQDTANYRLIKTKAINKINNT